MVSQHPPHVPNDSLCSFLQVRHPHAFVMLRNLCLSQLLVLFTLVLSVALLSSACTYTVSRVAPAALKRPCNCWT